MKVIIKKSSTKSSLVKEIELALLSCGRHEQYFTDGYVCRYHQVATSYAGLYFGDLALTNDKARTATVLAITPLHLVWMNKEGYKVPNNSLLEIESL